MMRWIDGRKVGRNDPCPCGGGLKLKKCCVRLADHTERRAVADRLPEMGIYVMATDLWPEPVSEETIQSSFSRFDGVDLAQTLAKLGVILQSRSEGRANEDELFLLRVILPAVWFNKIRLWLQIGNRRTALHRLLLLAAIRLAMICSTENGIGLKLQGREKELGPALLRLSSVLESDIASLLRSATTQPEKRAVLSASFYRNAFYDHVENLGNELGRYWALLMRAPDAVALRYTKEVYPLNQRYEELLGFPVILRMSVVFAVHRYYQRPVEEIIGDPQRFLLGEDYFAPITLENRSKVLTAMKSLSLTWNEHVAKMEELGEGKPDNKMQFFTLYDKPFVETEGGGFFPLDVQFLWQQGIEGTYWHLFNAVKATGSADELGRLRAYFGRCVEWYVSEILRSRTPEEARTVWLDWDEDFQAVEGSPIPDAVVYENGVLYFIEVTTSAVTPTEAISGDPVVLRAGLERVWFEGSGKRPGKLVQLQKSLDAYSSGSLVLRGFGNRPVRRVLPIVVSFRPLPQFPVISNWYGEIMREEGLPKSFCDTVTFMDIRDVEAMGPLKSLGIDWSIVERKLDSAVRARSISNFLIFDLGVRQIPRHEKVETWMRESFSAIEHSLFGRELSD